MAPDRVDDWNAFPGRPTHPDFTVLADLTLAADAASAEIGFVEYTSRWVDLPVDDLIRTAEHEAATLADMAASSGKGTLGAIGPRSWIVGYFAGLRIARDRPDLADEATVNAAGGLQAAFDVDMTSVVYVATHRTRALLRGAGFDVGASAGSAMVPVLASLWIDGLLVGSRFDARAAEIRR